MGKYLLLSIVGSCQNGEVSKLPLIVRKVAAFVMLYMHTCTMHLANCGGVLEVISTHLISLRKASLRISTCTFQGNPMLRSRLNVLDLPFPPALRLCDYATMSDGARILSQGSRSTLSPARGEHREDRATGRERVFMKSEAAGKTFIPGGCDVHVLIVDKQTESCGN
jgi:hypothetical protein